MPLVAKHPLTISSQFNNSRIYLQSVTSLLIVIDLKVELLNSLDIVDAVLVTREYLLPDAVSDGLIDLNPMFLEGDHKEFDRALVGLVLASLI